MILALLIAMLSLPAVAMPGHVPAPAAPMAAAVHHGDHGTPARSDPRHHADASCLGCIAPATIGSPRLAARLPTPAPAPVTRQASGAPYGLPDPATPPPRKRLIHPDQAFDGER